MKNSNERATCTDMDPMTAYYIIDIALDQLIEFRHMDLMPAEVEAKKLCFKALKQMENSKRNDT